MTMSKMKPVIEITLVFLFLLTITQKQTVWSLTLNAGQRIQSRPSAVATATILRHRQQELLKEHKRQKSDDITSTSNDSIRHSSQTTHPLPRKTSIFDIPQVEVWASERGLKEHHLKTIYHVVMNSFPFVKNGNHLDDEGNDVNKESQDYSNSWMARQSQILEEQLRQADFPKKHLKDLLDNFCICTSRIVEQRESASGGIKFIIQQPRGRNGNNSNILIETVLIQHTHKSSKTSRYTVCVSSQLGCAKGCSFCATGTMGLWANLSSADILEQVWLVRNTLIAAAESQKEGDRNKVNSASRKAAAKAAGSSLRNVVFMGMGEPLDNYDAVHEACRGLTHQCLFGFRGKHVTISTVGDSPRVICQLAEDAPQISLALSLHGATQQLRTTLIKSAKHAPLSELEDALDYHARATGQGAMLEYLLIDGINDKPVDADALVQFCTNRVMASTTTTMTSSSPASAGRNTNKKPFVNLIPYNPTLAGGNFGYQTPCDERVEAFHHRLRTNGVNSLVRWTSASGRDANGACGQLALTLRNQNKS